MRANVEAWLCRPAKSGVEIKEVGQDGEESDDSDFDTGSDANAVIQAAEMQLTTPYAVKEDFTRMLGTLVSLAFWVMMTQEKHHHARVLACA